MRKIRKFEEFNPDEIETANKTSRSRGAVGKRAIVPRLVPQYASKSDKILDFGAGKDAVHTLDLREQGYDVTAYEFGSNINPDIHDKDALKRNYDVVYASNVLNVQVNERMFRDTINEIKDVMHSGSIFIGNYPSAPRKWGIKGREIKEYLEDEFSSVEVIHGGLSTPVFLCRK